MFKTLKSLGLALTETGLVAAEVSAGKGALRTAQVAFGPDRGLEQPVALGKELKRVLHERGMTASRCVIGLPASRLATREKVLPPTDAASLRGALSIAVEREFASGAGELCFDYCASSTPKACSAMLAAAPRATIESLQAVAQAAGLTVTGVVPTAAALAAATRGVISPGGRIVLHLHGAGAELVVQTPDGPRMLRHLAVRPDAAPETMTRLAQELRRVLLTAPSQAQGPRELVLWDTIGLDRASLDSLARQVGLPPRICQLVEDLGVSPDADSAQDIAAAPAAALARSQGQAAAIDFLHSRLAEAPARRFGRRTVYAGLAAAVLLACSLAAYLDWHDSQKKLADLRGQLDSLKEPSQQAHDAVDKITFAQGWYDQRPRFLECLRQIAAAFPQEGTIWATNLMIQKDMQAVLTGRTVNKAAALELVDRLKSNPRLANVKPLFLSQGENGSGDVSFSVSLSLRSEK